MAGIFLTFSQSFGVFEAHFLKNLFLVKEFVDEELTVVGHSMGMLLDTRKSIFGCQQWLIFLI